MDTGAVEVKGAMEQRDVDNDLSFWVGTIIRELHRQNLKFENVEKDLGLPPMEIKNLHKKDISCIDVYLKLFKYLGLRIRLVNELGKPLERRRRFNVSKASTLSKINIQEAYIDMSSLYDARDRAVEEMKSLGKEYTVWGDTSHRRLQIAADNVMLINILEDLFRHGRKNKN